MGGWMEWRKIYILFFHFCICQTLSAFLASQNLRMYRATRNGPSVLNQTLIIRNNDYMDQVKKYTCSKILFKECH